MIKLKKILKESKFEEAVEGVEVSVYGMSPKVVAKVFAKALKMSFGTTAKKIVLELNKLMK
jgi:hypothetical protein|tara:strand:- start:86 stop:268 length:183 start_codon:yes stop_codon:yes gene_type:complete